MILIPDLNIVPLLTAPKRKVTCHGNEKLYPEQTYRHVQTEKTKTLLDYVYRLQNKILSEFISNTFVINIDGYR